MDSHSRASAFTKLVDSSWKLWTSLMPLASDDDPPLSISIHCNLCGTTQKVHRKAAKWVRQGAHHLCRAYAPGIEGLVLKALGGGYPPPLMDGQTLAAEARMVWKDLCLLADTGLGSRTWAVHNIEESTALRFTVNNFKPKESAAILEVFPDQTTGFWGGQIIITPSFKHGSECPTIHTIWVATVAAALRSDAELTTDRREAVMAIHAVARWLCADPRVEGTPHEHFARRGPSNE